MLLVPSDSTYPTLTLYDGAEPKTFGKGLCDVVIDDPFISKEHAHVRLENGKALLTPTGAQPVYLNAEGSFTVPRSAQWR